MGRATASIRAFLCSRTWATHILDVEAVGRYYGVEQKTMELSAVQGNLTPSFNIPPFDWLELQDLVMDHAAGRRLEERSGYKTWSAQFTSEVARWVTAATMDEGTISVLSITFNNCAVVAATSATCAATSCQLVSPKSNSAW
jgi:hypothetical protein